MRDWIECVILTVLLFAGVAFSGQPMEAKLVLSRGSITNRVPFTTVRTLSADTSEFFSMSMEVSPYDLTEACHIGVDSNIPTGFSKLNFDCVSESSIPATLVAPDIAIGCAHYHNGVGDEVIFGGHTTRVVRVEVPEGWRNRVDDFCFMELEPDVSVQPCLLAPTNWPDYFGLENYFFYGIPTLSVSASGSIGIQEMYGVYDTSAGMKYPNELPRGAYISPLWVGDSGSPCFLIIEGRLVLIGVFTSIKTINYPYMDLMPIKRSFL